MKTDTLKQTLVRSVAIIGVSAFVAAMPVHFSFDNGIAAPVAFADGDGGGGDGGDGGDGRDGGNDREGGRDDAESDSDSFGHDSFDRAGGNFDDDRFGGSDGFDGNNRGGNGFAGNDGNFDNEGRDGGDGGFGGAAGVANGGTAGNTGNTGGGGAGGGQQMSAGQVANAIANGWQ